MTTCVGVGIKQYTTATVVALYQACDPISGQTGFRVKACLRRKENSSLGSRHHLQVHLRCHFGARGTISVFRFKNIEPIPFR